MKVKRMNDSEIDERINDEIAECYLQEEQDGRY